MTTARSRGTQSVSQSSWSRAWWVLLAGCVLVVGVVDTTLVALSTGFFSSGFNGVYIDSLPWYAGYAMESVVLDLMLVLGIWALLLPLLALLRVQTLQVLALAGSIAAGLPLLFAAARYDLYARLGNMVSVSLLRDVAQGSKVTMVVQAFQNMEAVELLVPLFAVLCLLIVTVSARKLEPRFADVERRFAPPPLRSVWAALAVCVVPAMLLVALPSESASRLRYGLRAKLSEILLMEFLEHATDFDGDGSGWLSQPPDPALLDGAVYPYAIDIPGNGRDENGIAGDHPVAFTPVPVESAAAPQAGTRPHVLLIFLETFRGELLGARLDGREITPYLNALVREGSSSLRAFAHCPSTVPSRAQLFTGSLAYRGGRSTLIDDFKGRGYTVGYFSGQDESFGDSESLLGVGRADVFYDARLDVARRTSRSALPASLQVSWKTVLSRVREFLSGVDPGQPLFLYVNFTDPHFPYFHGETDAILDVEPITRSDIRADQAEKVWKAYANTVANVDRAVEELIAAWRAALGGADHAIVITADHGQAFYENGYLGHGESLDESQTRIPLILWGIGGDWPEPLGLADIRGLLWRNLQVGRKGGAPVARFVPDPARRILQWAANAERPHLIGLRGLERTVLYDFRKDQLSALTTKEERVRLSPEEERAELHALIWNWETVQRREAESGPDARD